MRAYSDDLWYQHVHIIQTARLLYYFWITSCAHRQACSNLEHTELVSVSLGIADP